MLHLAVVVSLCGLIALSQSLGRRSAGLPPLTPFAWAARTLLWTPPGLLIMAFVQAVCVHLGMARAVAVLLSWLAVCAAVTLATALSAAAQDVTVWRRGTRLADANTAPVRSGWSRIGSRPAAQETDAPLALSIGSVPIPEEDEPKHFKMIGTTGTGKSTAIQTLLAAALARGDRAVIADPDGGYLQRNWSAARGDLILNPFDRRSVVWQPFDEISEPHDARELARSLIGSASGEAAAWHGYAETFLAAVLERLKSLPEANSAELYRVISGASLSELRALLAGTSAAPLVDTGNERMFGSVRSIAISRLAALPAIARQSGVHASVRQWIRDGAGVLYLPYQADQIATLRHLISAWMRLAIFETMALGESQRRLWFVVDELDALGAIDGLKDALARLRKFGGRCVLGFQSIAQVSGTYGEAESRTIVENCATTLILRCSASDGGGTARFASQLIGQREVERVQETRSRGEHDRRIRLSHTRQVALESAVLPSEIESLADLQGYLKRASDPTWQKVHLTYPRARELA